MTNVSSYKNCLTFTIVTTHVKFISNTPALRKKPDTLVYSLPSGLRECLHIYKAKHTVIAATKQAPAAKQLDNTHETYSNGTLPLSLSIYIICVWNVLSLDVYLMVKFDVLQFLYPNEEKFSNLKMVHGIYTTKKKKNMGLPFASLL